MDWGSTLVFWVHIAAIALGGAATFGIPVVGSRIAAAPPAARGALGGALMALSRMGRVALVLLLISGPLLAWMVFGGFEGLGPWFQAKMVLVVLFTLVLIWAGINGKRAMSGNAAAMARAPYLSLTSLVLFLAILFCAVAAFG